MNATDSKIDLDGIAAAEKRGTEWTREMATAVMSNDLQLTAGLAAHELLGMSVSERKSFAPVTAPAGKFTKEERGAIRSVVMRKIQREEQRKEDDACTALAEELREERKGNLGRPSTYSHEIGEEICGWIAAGKSVNKYCQHFGLDNAQIYRWLRMNEDFSRAYGQAHLDRADLLADQVLDMLDDIDPENITLEKLALAKLKVETRKWMAAKLKPGKWGEQKTVRLDHGGININIGIPKTGVVLENEPTPLAAQLQSAVDLTVREGEQEGPEDGESE